MAQTRIPDPGLTLTSPILRANNLALLPIGVYSGFEVDVTGPEELTVGPGQALLQDGVAYSEDASAIVNFTTPPIPTVFTLVAVHVETGLLGGAAVKLEIRTGKLEQDDLDDGIPLAYVKHPGTVPLAQGMVTLVGRVKVPEIITDLAALRRIDLLPPFVGAISAPVQAQVTIPGADANGGVVYTAVIAGPSTVQVRHVVAGLNTVLNVVVAVNQITVNLGTNGSGQAISTALQVAAAVLAHAPAAALVFAVATGTGLGKAAAAGYTALTGGLLATGTNVVLSYAYDRVEGITALRVAVLGAAPTPETYVIEVALRAGPRPPRKVLVTSNNPTSSSIAAVVRGTDGVGVTVTPASFGATAGWVTSELLVGEGVFTDGEFYILQLQITVPPAAALLLGRISIDADPFALI